MANPNDSYSFISSESKESNSDKSFVKKVKSRVSDLIPASISKWFAGEDNSERLTEDSDEDTCQNEPPLKRARLPSREEISSNFKDKFSVTLPPMIYSPVSASIKSDNCINVNNRKHVFNTFSQPQPGPSGCLSSETITSNKTEVKNNKGVEVNVNGDKNSDSDDSTSDYSSMARNESREATVSKRARMEEFKSHNIYPSRERSVVSQTRSLFSERGVSPRTNSSLSSRRPSFSSSTFGSLDFIDKTLLTKKVVNSPFYGGRTTYGGASAYSHRLMHKQNTDLKNTVKNAFEVKPASESVKTENATLSRTAKRILDTLEQYSTPVSEAKKIPNPPLRKSAKRDSLLSKYTGANPYFVREPKTSASNKELQVPSVPDLLKMKLKEKLQDSTVAVRQIAATSKAAQAMGEYKLRNVDEEQPNTKHVSKMKTKVSSLRKPKAHQELTTQEEVKLPEIALPITTLPKFDLKLSPAQSTITRSINTTSTQVITKETKTKKDNESKTETQVTKISKTESKVSTEQATPEPKQTTESFNFANPLVLISENIKNIIASNDFVFSKPLDKKLSNDIANNFKSTSSDFELKRKSPNKHSTPTYSSGSVMDIIKSKDEVKKSLTWECPVCLIRNVSDRDKCSACHAEKSAKPLTYSPKANNNKSTSNTLQNFLPSSDSWECSACMIRNKNDVPKCVACETPNPKAGQKTLTHNEGIKKFLPSTDTWECPVCMIRNKNDVPKCVACEAPNPKAGQKISTTNEGIKKFLPSPDTWECSTCMIRNKNDVPKCVACETPNPKSGQKNINPNESIKKPSSLSNKSNFGSAFKAKPNEWECDSCMVRNSENDKKCVCCGFLRPGSKPPAEPETNKKNNISAFNFGINNVEGVVTAKGFTFGIPKEVKKTEESSLPTSSFSFGVTKTNTEVTESKPNFFNGAITNTQKEASDKPATTPVFQTNCTNTTTTENKNNDSLVKFGSSGNGEKLPATSFTIPATSASTFTFGQDTSIKQAFGQEQTISSSKPPDFSFGSNNKQEDATNKKPNFNFGSSVSSGFSFGSSNNVPSDTKKEDPNKKNNFTFGSSVSGGFSFGSNNNPTAVSESNSKQEDLNKKPNFNFDSSSAGFSFGSNNNPMPVGGGFNFKPSFETKPQATNIFGNSGGGEQRPPAPAPSAITSPLQNGGFSFGSAPTKAAFNFGSQTPVPRPATGVFSFGNSAANPVPEPASSGGFNFTSTQCTVKPNFNFSAPGSTPTFSATPDSSAAPPVRRKIKALRRTQQR